jgi:glycosyltransferase involved in cell wall biosynthesis
MKKKILFIADQFTGGGAERMLINIVNNIDRSQFEIYLLVMYSNIAESMSESLSADVNFIKLNIDKNHKRDNNSILKFGQLSYLIKVHKIIKSIKPSIVFVNKTSLSAKLSPLILFHKNTTWIARETTADFKSTVKSKALSLIYKYFYFYNHIVGQSDDMINNMHEVFRINKNRFVKINNMIDVEYVTKRASEVNEALYDVNFINLVACGRVCKQKGFDLLVKAFAQLPQGHRFKLTIIGQKHDKYNPEDITKEIENLIVKYKLEDRVELKGFQPNPYVWIKEADYFILSSRYEGFPNVLVEALSLGKPCLVNECPGGINEIMKDGFNGLLFSFRKGDFAGELEKLCRIDFDHKAISEDINRRYSIKSIVPKYNELLIAEK